MFSFGGQSSTIIAEAENSLDNFRMPYPEIIRPLQIIFWLILAKSGFLVLSAERWALDPAPSAQNPVTSSKHFLDLAVRV